MKVTDIWTSKRTPTISFEVFPARTEKAAATFGQVIDELAALKPDFVSVTFGAGGSTREGSRQLAERLKKEKNLEVMAYFAGFGLGPDQITGVLDDYRNLGLDNVLIVRGDAPHDDEEPFRPHPESFAHASDLLKFVRPKYPFCVGAAGYPEGHIEAESKDKDLDYLRLKVDNGAEFIIANYFYDNRFYFDFLERCGKAGIKVPIVPGVMPIYSAKMMKILSGICGATIPEELEKKVHSFPPEDKGGLVKFGVERALTQTRELLKAGVPGLHIYTMDRSQSAAALVDQLRQDTLV